MIEAKADPKDWVATYASLEKEYDYRFVEGVEIANVKLLPGHLMVRWLHKEETKGIEVIKHVDCGGVMKVTGKVANHGGHSQIDLFECGKCGYVLDASDEDEYSIIREGNIILPQNRQRAHFMKGEVLAVAPDCKPLIPGQLIEFDGQCEKAFIGGQNPKDRDVVFVMRIERVYGTISYVNGKPEMDMIRDHILLRPDPHPSEVYGLTITETTGENVRKRSRSWVGEVLRTGERVESCVPGDRIAYETSYSAGLKLGDHNAELCIVIQDMDVVGLLEVA